MEGKCPYPFDHTSIIRTAFDLLLGRPEMHLTERDKVAPSFIHALDLDKDHLNQGPEEVLVPRWESLFLSSLVGAKIHNDVSHCFVLVVGRLGKSSEERVHIDFV